MISDPNETGSDQEIGTQLNKGACPKLHWCDSCNVPLLIPTCYRCGGQGRQFIADAKPVFGGEKCLLEEIAGKSLPDSLYASSNRIYYRGRFLFSLSASEGRVTVKSDHTDVLTMEDISNTNGRSLKIAVEANLPALRYLEQQAINSIVSVVREYPTRRPVVSFSGGKDSAVVAYLVQRALGNGNGVSLFFGDTTLEHPETEDYVTQFAEHYGLPLDIRRAKADFFEMCNDLEPPSRILR